MFWDACSGLHEWSWPSFEDQRAQSSEKAPNAEEDPNKEHEERLEEAHWRG